MIAVDSDESPSEDLDANIYFKNVDYEITDQTLFDIFSYIGEIKSLHIVRDAKGRSRGFGFMSYYSPMHAQRAILELNGKFLGRKPIIVMLHIRKEERRMMKRIFQDHAERNAGTGVYHIGFLSFIA